MRHSSMCLYNVYPNSRINTHPHPNPNPTLNLSLSRILKCHTPLRQQLNTVTNNQNTTPVDLSWGVITCKMSLVCYGTSKFPTTAIILTLFDFEHIRFFMSSASSGTTAICHKNGHRVAVKTGLPFKPDCGVLAQDGAESRQLLADTLEPLVPTLLVIRAEGVLKRVRTVESVHLNSERLYILHGLCNREQNGIWNSEPYNIASVIMARYSKQRWHGEFSLFSTRLQLYYRNYEIDMEVFFEFLSPINKSAGTSNMSHFHIGRKYQLEILISVGLY